MHKDRLLVILRFCYVKYDVIPSSYQTRASTFSSLSMLKYLVKIIKKKLRFGPRKICPDLVLAASDVVALLLLWYCSG